MKTLFISPPATSYIEYKPEHENPLEVALPRIPFEVFAHLENSIEPAILDLDWEMDKDESKDYGAIISEKIRKENPDYVLTSVFAQSACDVVDQITTAAKEEDGKLPVIVGGQAIPHLREHIFHFCPNVDIACLSAESLNVALSTFDSIKPKTILNGHAPSRVLSFFAPEQMYKGFPIKEYVEYYKSRGIKAYAYLENERGCPFHCTFCAVPRFVQERPVDATIAEAKFLLENGIEAFYLTDLTFGLNRKKAQELLFELGKLRRQHPKFHFRCITRVDFVDKTMVELLRSAGCYEIAFGVESSSTEALVAVKKNTTREQNLEAISIAANGGLSVRLFLILGLPDEDFTDLIHFLHEVNGITKNILLQISLLRDIVGEKFRNRIASGELTKGNMHQLDFRTDGRKYNLDNNDTIANFILLASAWPSTEISPNGNERLQNRLLDRESIRIYTAPLKNSGIARRKDILLIDALDNRIVYVPKGKSIKIRQCLMECSDDFFEFLALADGTRDFEGIANELAEKFSGKAYYEAPKNSRRRAKKIHSTLVQQGIIRIN